MTGEPHLQPSRRRSGRAPRPTSAPARNGRVELPVGWRLWQPRDEIVVAPLLHRDAYHGPVGRYLDLLDGRTEAHPAAVGIEVLASVGTLIGRRAYYQAGRIRQHANLFAAVVGPSSEGAKGVADDETRALVEQVSPGFAKRHGMGGLGSGETLVRELDDEREPPAERCRIVADAELVSVLKVAKRDGSILGDVLRKAFDYAPLRHSTIGSKTAAVASNHHVSLVGSITPEDLRAHLDELSMVNGLGNRFLYVWSQMRDPLPFGAEIDKAALAEIADSIDAALGKLADRNERRPAYLALNPRAKSLWGDFYRVRRRGVDAGHLKALTSRQVAHAARLAVIYAVLDGSAIITRAHVAAAIAWCDYSIDTIRVVFPDPVAGRAARLLAAIRAAVPDGLNGRQQHELFHGHLDGDELDELRAELENEGLVYTAKLPTAGRSRLLSVPVTRI